MKIDEEMDIFTTQFLPTNVLIKIRDGLRKKVIATNNLELKERMERTIKMLDNVIKTERRKIKNER